MNKQELYKAIWSKILKSGEQNCWPWNGYVDADGYGKYSYRVGSRKEGKVKRASSHKIAYESTKGGIPDGLILRHSCHNPICCNPNHLIPGTNQDNSNDMVKAGRSLRGAKNHKAKLSASNVCRILALRFDKKKTLKEIAKKFNVHLATIGYICQGKTWKHLNTSIAQRN